MDQDLAHLIVGLWKTIANQAAISDTGVVTAVLAATVTRRPSGRRSSAE